MDEAIFSENANCCLVMVLFPMRTFREERKSHDFYNLMSYMKTIVCIANADVHHKVCIPMEGASERERQKDRVREVRS